MFRRWTTISCSAVALTLPLTAWDASDAFAQTSLPRHVKQTYAADDPKPLATFPVAIVWTIDLHNAVTAPPAYDERRGFFPIEGGRIVAYDLVSGEQIWLAPLRATSQPVVGDGLLFVATGDALTAVHATDGSIAWSLPFAERLAARLVWDKGSLIAVTGDADVIAYHAADGELIWRHHLDAAAVAPPALSAERVYLSTGDSRVVALRVDNGNEVWRRRLRGPARDILAFEDRLFVGSQDKNFYCIEAATGEVGWHWRTGADTVGAPAADGNTIFFVATDNVLRALSRRSGVQRWKTGLSLRPTAGPLVGGATVVVGGAGTGETQLLRAYNMTDGKPNGEFDISAELAAAPHAVTVPNRPLPLLILVTRHLVKGSTVLALGRSFDPPVVNAVAPLPNPVVLPETLPTPPPDVDER